MLELLGNINTPSYGDELATSFGWRLGTCKIHLKTPTSFMEELSKSFPNERVQQHFSSTRDKKSTGFNIKLNIYVKGYFFPCLQL